MYKKIIIALLLIFTNSFLFGNIKTATEAEKIALQWFSNNNQLSKNVQKNILKVETKQYQGEEVLHIINLSPSGFVIVSANDNAQPILAYSENNNLDIQMKHPGFIDLLNQYAKYVYNISQSSNSNNQHLWDNIENSNTILGNIEPLVKTKWNQDWPYNKLSPIDSAAGPNNNYRTYAGCVATAMSQLMKYYNYPDSGNGSHSYNWSTYGTLSANFDTTRYDWANMLPSIAANSPEINKNAIAELMYHCGIAVNMMFGPDGSGAYSSEVPETMQKYFNYSSEIQYLGRGWYSEENWMKILIAELSDNRPIYYHGQNDEGGHAFVCDGFERSKLGDLFHFNWGWSGSGNGYFSINDIAFNSGQGIIRNFAPKGQIAKFKVDHKTGVEPHTVQFTDITDGDITSWEWDFDYDGKIDSYEQNPVWTYEESGDYTVLLKITKDSTSFQKTNINMIEVVSENEIYGTILTSRTLDKGKVKVLGNILIPEGVTLNILPGVEMEMQGNYEIKVDGNIIARGTRNDSIAFTIADTAGFSNISVSSGGWKGLYLSGKANDTTTFSFCKFEFVKKSKAIFSINNNTLNLTKCSFSNNIGSALGFWFNDEKHIKIDKCLFENNINHGSGNFSNWGTAIVGYYANLDVTNSIFSNNVMAKSGAISLANSSSLNLVNCTIINNIPSDNTSAVLNLSLNSELNLQNSIMWNDGVNEINFSDNNIASISYNDLQSGLMGIVGDAPQFKRYEANINVHPQITDNSFKLLPWSQCIDRGIIPDLSLIIDTLDFNLNPRLSLPKLDLGATEFFGNVETFDVGFSANIVTGGYPLTVTFTDTTKIDNIISIWWDFENNGQWDTSNSTEISYTYTRPGIYTVSMLAMTSDSIPVFTQTKDMIVVTGTATSIDEEMAITIPETFYLAQNYPNPFNPSTNISYGIPVATNVTLEIYNILGQKINTLENCQKTAGNYNIIWNGKNATGQIVPTGIYFYKLQSEQFNSSKKMFFMK